MDLIIGMQMMALAEETFGSRDDPDQMPVTQESADKLSTLTPDWLKYKVDPDGRLMSFAVVTPTTREIAERFLSGEITEREILELTTPQERYSALYLASAVTVPEFRRQGVATELLKELIAGIPTTDDPLLFAWTFNDGGKALVKRLESVLGREIKYRERHE